MIPKHIQTQANKLFSDIGQHLLTVYGDQKVLPKNELDDKLTLLDPDNHLRNAYRVLENLARVPPQTKHKNRRVYPSDT